MNKIFEAFIAGLNQPRKELSKVHLIKGKAVATDTYKLIELEVSKEDIAVINNIALPIETKLFPEYKRIIPTDKELKEEYVCVRVDAKYLRDVADAMGRCSDDKDKRHPPVDLYVPKSNTKALVFKTNKATALLMPLYK